jgi:dihydrofolate reductase
MRKLFTFNMMSLDGFFEGPGGSLDWHRVDEEFVRFALEQLAGLDTILFGRRTYEMMAGFWPSAEAIRADPDTAEAMNRLPKVVFSRSLGQADWHNSRLIKTDAAGAIKTLKTQPGKDMAIFGSANLIASLMPSGVIDQQRVMVNPLLLGQGTPLFQGLSGTLPLQFVSSRAFGNGNVLLCYAQPGVG